MLLCFFHQPSSAPRERSKVLSHKTQEQGQDAVQIAVDHFLDPITGSVSTGKRVSGVICLHVDDLYMTGDTHFQTQVMKMIRRDFTVGSESKNDLVFVGQHVKWCDAQGTNPSYIQVDQNKAIEELAEIVFDKSLKDDQGCEPSMHTAYRSVVGQINWLQSRTQFHVCVTGFHAVLRHWQARP